MRHAGEELKSKLYGGERWEIKFKSCHIMNILACQGKKFVFNFGSFTEY